MKQNGFKIEKGIPLPAPSQTKYPFSEMEVGDSVSLPMIARQSAYLYAKRHNIKFVTKNQGSSIRVWRTA